MLRRAPSLLARGLEGWQAAQARTAVGSEASSWLVTPAAAGADAPGRCGCGGTACATCSAVAAPAAAAGALAARALHTSAGLRDASSNASAGQASSSSGNAAGGSGSGRGRRRRRPALDPLTGYKASSLAGDDSWPAERLKIRLREDDTDAAGGSSASTEDAAGSDALDLFSLSRSLGADEAGGGGGSSGEPGGGGGGERREGPARRVLGADEERTLSKLVGCLTKEGKRSRAQRVLNDALHIINAQLRKGGGGAAAAGGSGGSRS